MKSEVDARCKNQCTEAQIKLRCQRRWLLQVDFLTANISAECFADGTAKTCFDAEEATASTAQEQCATTGKGTCETQYQTCKTSGKVDSTFKEAEAFCTSR